MSPGRASLPVESLQWQALFSVGRQISVTKNEQFYPPTINPKRCHIVLWTGDIEETSTLEKAFLSTMKRLSVSFG